MFFSISLYIALLIFGIGVIFKVALWFRYKVGDEALTISTGNRVAAAVKGVITTIFSGKLFILIKIFILDILFQRPILKESFSRWLMHIFIFFGFMLLLLMHALEEHISVALFSNYASTLNPFMFLRNLFGAMVIVGVCISIYRRIKVKGMRMTTRAMDKYAIVILAIIMVSGFFLEATKIVSHNRFDEMVEEYAGLEEGDEELTALKAYWEKEFLVVFPKGDETVDEDILEQGKESHETNCAECHSKPSSAFISFGVAKALRPMALGLANAGMDTVLLYVHFLACFIGLAYLPFSKFFHILVSPVSLLANGVMDRRDAEPAGKVTRRVMELDACMHCATCTIHCSVGPVFREISNGNILPSEKLISLKALVAGKDLNGEELRRIQEGSHICTSCHRCTDVCPAGINLQDLWFSIREELARRGYPEPFVWARNVTTGEFLEKIKGVSYPLVPSGNGLQKELSLSAQADTFSSCFECQTCTNVCPVVANYENPKQELGLLPHQIMHSLGLGLRDHAMSSKMTWDCVTCYMCQEHCPQGVQVTDVLYELKHKAYARLKTNGHKA